MLYDKNQQDLIISENNHMTQNKIPHVPLYFDNHNLHIEAHKQLLNFLLPSKETFWDKVLYFLKLKRRIKLEILDNHVQDHIDILKVQSDFSRSSKNNTLKD